MIDEYIVEARNVTKEYRLGKQTVTALDGVSLAIRKGEFVAIVGASGSGKSTLLHMLGCLDRPTKGEIFVNGQNVASLCDEALSKLRQKTVGFVFQSFYLQPFLNLEDNVSVPAMFTDKKRQEITAKTMELLKKVGLTEQAKHYPRELSGGQIQRAAVARALVNDPGLILADEPTGNLDSANSQAIVELFREICTETGATVVIVTHDREIAEQSDRIITLKDGKIL